MNDQFTGYAGTSEFLLAKVSILPLPVASSPENCLPSSSLVQLQLRIPSKSFFVYLIRASQQLVPHFLILALSLNPVYEYSELI